MDSTTFSPALRVLLCPQCGGAIDAKAEGGLYTCSYCNVKMMLASRLDIAQAAPAAPPPPDGPSQRLEMLRAQDGKPLLPPPNLRYLLRAGELSSDQLNEAMQEWQKTRSQLIAEASPVAAERLYFLTLLLHQYYKKEKDLTRVRALLETALELLIDPRHVQEVRCMMARLAAANGEMDSAKQWLAMCEAEPSDLHMDSAYRFTRSTLATRDGDWNEVLKQLGENLVDLPIADEFDGVCGVLRANACEKLGQLDKAKLLVKQLAGKPGVGAPMIAEILKRYQAEHLSLCVQSAAELLNPPATGKGKRRFGIIRLAGLAAFVIGAGLILARWIPLSFIPRTEDFNNTTLTIGLILLIWGASSVMLKYTLRLFLGGAGGEQLRKTGLAGKAEIVALTPTGWTINDVPQYKMELLITVHGQEPYTARQKIVMKPDQLPYFQPGVTLGVKVDSKKKQKFILET